MLSTRTPFVLGLKGGEGEVTVFPRWMSFRTPSKKDYSLLTMTNVHTQDLDCSSLRGQPRISVRPSYLEKEYREGKPSHLLRRKTWTFRFGTAVNTT